MMKSSRFVVALLLVAAMILSLVGCSGSSSDGTQAAASGTASSAAASSAEGSESAVSGAAVSEAAASSAAASEAVSNPLTEESPDGIHSSIQRTQPSPEWVTNLEAAKDENTKQLFIVAGVSMETTTAYISMHQRDESGQWNQILSTPGYVGKNGLCLDADHKEGCAQTPVGTYHFNKAFGIAPNPGTAFEYTQVDNDTYWSGDAREGMHYNEMVDIKDFPDLQMDDSEHIVDYEYQYQYCLNISFNEDGTPGRGSAIFLHCLGPQKPWTGGCVSVPENIMKLIMQKVDPECVVVIDTLENLKVEF